jgi:hypothetical protein
MTRFVLILASGLMLVLSTTRSYATPADTLRASCDYSKDGMNLIGALTPDKDIFEKWDRPQLPKVVTSTSYKRGEHVIPLIIYSFDSSASAPYPPVSYDITILKPDGTTYGHADKLLVHEAGSAQSQRMYLAKQPLDIGIEQNDLLGVYEIQIIIHIGTQQVTRFPVLSFEVIE